MFVHTKKHIHMEPLINNSSYEKHRQLQGFKTDEYDLDYGFRCSLFLFWIIILNLYTETIVFLIYVQTFDWLFLITSIWNLL